MKITLERSVLIKALARVQRVAERRNTIPILSNALLRAGDGQLLLKATDLELEITETVGGDVEEAGGTTVPAHMFHDIVRKLSEGSEVSLALSQDASRLTLKSGRAQFNLMALPVEDFPDISTGDYTHSFALSRDAVAQLIERTQFAISSEETRYYLNGIYLHTLEGDTNILRAVATDGHRLALSEMAAPEGAHGMPGIIIPRKTIGEILRLLDGQETPIQFDVSETKLRVRCADIELVSKLIDGVFPDYERVIPRGNDRKMVADRDRFSHAVDRVSTVLSERSRAVKLSLDEGTLTLDVNSPEAGSAVEEIGVDYNAERLEIGFNAKYLLDIMGQLTSSETEFLFSGPGSPALIQNENENQSLYVLMPMRV